MLPKLRENIKATHAEQIKLVRVDRQATNSHQFILGISRQQRLTWVIKARNALLPFICKPFDVVEAFKQRLISQIAEASR